jgi:DNA invertase Pin-like site-specific DNA recombinase
MKRPTVIYVRVSSANQAEKGYSLATQIEACQKYAEQNDLEVVVIESDDKSGPS